ncbi:MAG: hypothetical protein PHO02_02590 [Candidatus Nanoarchaeia archaeon]|nr:hypothetical protein [Candidatus Nanoarchaeia archaeon]
MSNDLESKTNECRCDSEGCTYNAVRRFVVTKEDILEKEVFSCGIHDIKFYKTLSSEYWPHGYKITVETLEDGKWKNWKV